MKCFIMCFGGGLFYVALFFKGKDDGSVKGLMSVLSNPDTLSGEKMQQILDRKQAYLSFWP